MKQKEIMLKVKRLLIDGALMITINLLIYLNFEYFLEDLESINDVYWTLFFKGTLVVLAVISVIWLYYSFRCLYGLYRMYTLNKAKKKLEKEKKKLEETLKRIRDEKI